MNYQVQVGKKDFKVSVEKQGDGYVTTAVGKTFSFAAPTRLGDSTWRFFEGKRSLTLTADIYDNQIRFWLDGEKITAEIQAAGAAVEPKVPLESKGSFVLKSAMPGLVKKIKVTPGQRVEKGQGLLVLEAMKMENEIVAPRNGKVESVAVKEKQSVESQAILLTLR